MSMNKLAMFMLANGSGNGGSSSSYPEKIERKITLIDNSSENIYIHKLGVMNYLEEWLTITLTNVTKTDGVFYIGYMESPLCATLPCWVMDSSGNYQTGLICLYSDVTLILNGDATSLNGEYTIGFFGSWMEPYKD